MTENSDKRATFLGLAATAPGELGSCPSDEELTAFGEQQLTASRSNAITAHLADCNSCRHLWLELEPYLEKNLEQAAVSTRASGSSASET